MEGTKLLFNKLGFHFNGDIKVYPMLLDSNPSLNAKINKHTYLYQKSSQTHTTFYLIDAKLSDEELIQVRSHIWNENKADLLFCRLEGEGNDIHLLYTRYSPKVENKTCEIAQFNPNEEDESKLENIKNWQFDSGAFWLNYHEFLKKAIHKSIDRELIYTLKSLKVALDDNLQLILPYTSQRKEIVQALIDRTLYIKYLEDNHIINSHFYKHYFDDENSNYKNLLREGKPELLNKLYSSIHRIFNNSLFDNPTIEEDYLNRNVCDLIHKSLNADVNSNQLRLFDFKFNLIPVEFISYIYEVFLTDKQQKEGIFYTPKKLAQLIIDDVMPDDSIGSVLDPSCGSGMFLIVAFQKLLEQSQERETQSIEERIALRTKLLAENIFGIEKQPIARRFTVFSLSLQLFRGLSPDNIKDYISNKLSENEEVSLFGTLNFFDNILCSNSLSQKNIPFENKSFDFIVGNPPFARIGQEDEEMSFLTKYSVNIGDKELLANKIIGKHQISQCFFLKIKDWSHEKTRFGFVSNSSNFSNTNTSNTDNSILSEFQNYFYTQYNIEKIYELSRVKKTLFENAKEDVVSLVFSNKMEKENIIDYYPVKMGIFSNKPFNLLIINEDDKINIPQVKLQNSNLKLRDYLVGNEYDRQLVETVKDCNILNGYIRLSNRNRKYIHRGVELVSGEKIINYYNIDKDTWNKFDKAVKGQYYEQYKNEFTSLNRSSEYETPYIKNEDIDSFKVIRHSLYIGNLDMAHRARTKTPDLYCEDRILISRVGKRLKSVYVKEKIICDFELYTIKLKEPKYYAVIEAILNSEVINYFIIYSLKKRLSGSFPKIGVSEISQIPIPNLECEDNAPFIKELNELSTSLHKDEVSFKGDIKERVNSLVFSLYGLRYLQKQRITDSSLPKTKLSKSLNELANYIDTLLETIQMFLEDEVIITKTNAAFGMVVVKVDLSGKDEYPTASKTKNYILNEIFEINPHENFLASRERIYGNSCVYIIRNNINTSWTETKAYEDGQKILAKVRTNE